MAEIPKNHMQALARLAEGVGNALVQWGHDVRGIDPIELAPEEPERHEVDVPIPVKKVKAVAPPRKPIPRPRRYTRSQWRNIFMEMGDTFTIKDIEEKHRVSRPFIKDRIEEMDEVVLVREARPGRGGSPAAYKFDATVGQPKPNGHVKKTPEELRKRQTLHPLRQAGGRKPSTSNRHMQTLVDQSWEQGWLVTLTGSGHFKFMSPDEEKTVFGPQTPSDWRSVKNARAELRRAGLEIV